MLRYDFSQSFYGCHFLRVFVIPDDECSVLFVAESWCDEKNHHSAFLDEAQFGEYFFGDFHIGINQFVVAAGIEPASSPCLLA